MDINLIFFFICVFIETIIWYWYFYKKTKLNRNIAVIDSILTVVFSYLIIYFLYEITNAIYLLLFIALLIVLFVSFIITMLRFWRTPKRKIPLDENVIVSPADGQIIYIKRIDKNSIPISIKNGVISELKEITKTSLVQTPCWIIGINMTPLDVHKNCSPIAGKVILSKHTPGKFLSLKKNTSETENERHTYVIKKQNIIVGVIQIASRLVRRIDSYVKENDYVKKGEWIGMIRFGSQVDVIFPISCKINVELNQQVYACQTKIAEL